MKIEFDPNKDRWNLENRGLAFSLAAKLDWETALVIEDVRQDYPEPRFVATALLDERLCVLCFTPIQGGIRVISFRKANKREVKRYEQATLNQC